jgi:hypothetical protein
VTKDQYYEMCEALGNEPLESELPVEYDDLPLEVQAAIRIYNSMQDNWDYMNGNYIGKSYVGFKDILDIFEVGVEDRRAVYDLVASIDRIRSKAIRDAKPKT